MAKRKTNEFRQERIDYAKDHSLGEKAILPFVRKALKATIAPVIAHVELYGLNNLIPEALINRNVWREMYPKIYQQLGIKFARKEFYRQRSLEPVAEKASAIEFLLNVWTSQLRDFALNYTYHIERELNETTIKVLKEALGNVYDLGIDTDGKIRLFLKDIKAKFRMRAGTIGRTEATTISNLGKDIGARGWIEQQGGEGYKVWIGRNDSRERPTHLQENNTIIEINDYFIVGGEQCQRAGDVNLSAKERIGCRCTISYMSQNRYNGYVKRGRIVDGKLVGAS